MTTSTMTTSTMTTSASAPSPLSEASPASLEEIFSSSPLERTDEEWLSIVSSLLAQREKWRKDEAAGKTRASAPKKAPLKPVPQELTPEDLGL